MQLPELSGFGGNNVKPKLDARDSFEGTDLLWNTGVGSSGSKVPLVVNSSSKTRSYNGTVPVFLTDIV